MKWIIDYALNRCVISIYAWPLLDFTQPYKASRVKSLLVLEIITTVLRPHIRGIGLPKCDAWPQGHAPPPAKMRNTKSLDLALYYYISRIITHCAYCHILMLQQKVVDREPWRVVGREPWTMVDREPWRMITLLITLLALIHASRHASSFASWPAP